MRSYLPSLKRQIKAQRYKDIPVTLSLFLIPFALTLLLAEDITTACLLNIIVICIYVITAFVIRSRRPLFFRPLLYAAGILVIVVLEKSLG